MVDCLKKKMALIIPQAPVYKSFFNNVASLPIKR